MHVTQKSHHNTSSKLKLFSITLGDSLQRKTLYELKTKAVKKSQEKGIYKVDYLEWKTLIWK